MKISKETQKKLWNLLYTGSIARECACHKSKWNLEKILEDCLDLYPSDARFIEDLRVKEQLGLTKELLDDHLVNFMTKFIKENCNKSKDCYLVLVGNTFVNHCEYIFYDSTTLKDDEKYVCKKHGILEW